MILDSNILIGYINGDEKIRTALYAWHESGTVLFISHVSVVETLSRAALTADDISRIESFLNDFIIIPIDMEIARYASALRRTHSLALADALLVATAHVSHVQLVSRDKKLQKLFSAVAI